VAHVSHTRKNPQWGHFIGDHYRSFNHNGLFYVNPNARKSSRNQEQFNEQIIQSQKILENLPIGSLIVLHVSQINTASILMFPCSSFIISLSMICNEKFDLFEITNS